MDGGTASTVPMAMIEAALRGGAVTLLAVLALLLLRDARRAPAGLYGALFTASVAAYVTISAPELVDHPPVLWLAPARFASLGTPAMFWLFARASFDDAFEASWRDVLPWAGLVAVGFLCARHLLPQICLLYHGLQLIFVALAMREAFIGRAADLVEERRKFRVVLIVAAAIYTAIDVSLEAVMGGPPTAPPLSTINAAGLLTITFGYVAARLTLLPRAELITAEPAGPSQTAQPALPSEIAAPIYEQEVALLERLRRLMEEEKVYREEGLSIAALAAKLSAPEYRLRRLINQRLGHRNFSTFVNGYRLGDAMAALSDRSQAEVPVVTIALDAGFQSLGPFNRAFKAHTGMTPTDYRRQRAGGERGSPSFADSGIGQPS